MAVHRGFRHKHTFLLLYKHKPLIFTLWLCWEKSCADTFFSCWETSFCVYFYCLHNKASDLQPKRSSGAAPPHVYPTGESHDHWEKPAPTLKSRGIWGNVGKQRPHVYQPVLFVQIKEKVPTVGAEAPRPHLEEEKHQSRSGQRRGGAKTKVRRTGSLVALTYQAVSQSCDAEIKQLVMELKIRQPLNHQTAESWGRAEAEIQSSLT